MCILRWSYITRSCAGGASTHALLRTFCRIWEHIFSRKAARALHALPQRHCGHRSTDVGHRSIYCIRTLQSTADKAARHLVTAVLHSVIVSVARRSGTADTAALRTV